MNRENKYLYRKRIQKLIKSRCLILYDRSYKDNYIYLNYPFDNNLPEYVNKYPIFLTPVVTMSGTKTKR